jgi:hypothetical protein
MRGHLRALTIVALVSAAAAAGAAGAVLAHGQTAIQPVPVPPTIMSGGDIGFRMTARKGATPVGQLVVKVDGEWREVEFSYGMKQLMSK